MPSGSSKNKKGDGTDLISTTEVCALCCDTLEKGQDILKCEGSCGCNIHRYCAGVTELYFDELVKGSIPFVCQYCALNDYNTIIQQVQDEVFSHPYGTDGDLCLNRTHQNLQNGASHAVGGNYSGLYYEEGKVEHINCGSGLQFLTLTASQQ